MRKRCTAPHSVGRARQDPLPGRCKSRHRAEDRDEPQHNALMTEIIGDDLWGEDDGVGGHRLWCFCRDFE
jgi:hypothetical protein